MKSKNIFKREIILKDNREVKFLVITVFSLFIVACNNKTTKHKELVWHIRKYDIEDLIERPFIENLSSITLTKSSFLSKHKTSRLYTFFLEDKIGYNLLDNIFDTYKVKSSDLDSLYGSLNDNLNLILNPKNNSGEELIIIDSIMESGINLSLYKNSWYYNQGKSKVSLSVEKIKDNDSLTVRLHYTGRKDSKVITFNNSLSYYLKLNENDTTLFKQEIPIYFRLDLMDRYLTRKEKNELYLFKLKNNLN